MSKKLLCVLFSIACFPVSVFAGSHKPPPHLNKSAHQTLQAMSAASTWGHPDLYGQFTGMRNYADGDYKSALKYFKYGARYADKLSQLSIGLMYLNGNGVTKDVAKAWAWLAIAAERGYPKFVATRDRVWKGLNAEQRKRALKVRKRLSTTYGDAVAKPRMRHELNYWRTQMTGSRTGFNSGVKHIDKAMLAGGVPNPACNRKSIAGAPIAGCGGNIYAKWRWDPDKYFQAVDSQWQGTVDVGALQQVNPSAKSKTQAQPPAAAPASSTPEQ